MNSHRANSVYNFLSDNFIVLKNPLPGFWLTQIGREISLFSHLMKLGDLIVQKMRVTLHPVCRKIRKCSVRNQLFCPLCNCQQILINKTSYIQSSGAKFLSKFLYSNDVSIMKSDFDIFKTILIKILFYYDRDLTCVPFSYF